jgi:4,4'-diaponeurosporenoate glycosyltransferase
MYFFLTLVPIACGIAAGFWLFRTRALQAGPGQTGITAKLSVIIPARNEEKNLPYLLGSLREQTLRPFEIIVVDDFSEDRTAEIAACFGATVITNEELPPGWTGKSWAVWNGYRQASGDLIAFLDADVRLAPEAFETLVQARERSGGVISVVPFHLTEKFYEKLAMVTNILGVMAFTSPYETANPRKGLYGSCILTTKAHYDLVSGHESIRSEVLDDLNLGAKYVEAGIPVTNFLGCGFVSFRMYPLGLHSELEGFAKGAVLSTSKLRPGTLIGTALWTIGVLLSGAAPVLALTPWGIPLGIGYLLYALQIFYFVRKVGRFGILMPILHALSSLFFMTVMIYSAYQVAFLGHVAWKGRKVKVGGRMDA